MRYKVLFTEGAEYDLEAIHNYISQFDSPASADHVLEQLLEATEALATFPERGSYPKNCWPSVSGTIARLSSSLAWSTA